MNVNDSFRYLSIGLPDDIRRKKEYGDFEGALSLIQRELDRPYLPYAMRMCLTAEQEILKRLPEHYPYTRETALQEVRAHIPDFTEAEFDQKVEAGKILWIYLNGEPHYFARFFPTLCKADPKFAIRAGVVLQGTESDVLAGTAKQETPQDRCIRLMKETGSYARRIRIRATAKVKDSEFKPGMFVRVHLPIPAACEEQSEIRIEKVFPENAMIAPEDAPQRTVCWEETLQENHEFSVEYSYIHRANFRDTAAMLQGTYTGPDFKAAYPAPTEADVQEIAPHVIFTPYIKALAEELAGSVTDPLEKAKIFYDYISLNMKYTFMPDYFCEENIAENCARNFTGDCGVFAMLLITLLRYSGIPAVWQSGFAAEPGFIGGHDWLRFYVEPYGWIYADPSYGTAAVRAENEERRQFYFGNLDAYRTVLNNAIEEPFTVEKQFFRADPYDNQLGEIETDERGLTYGEFIRTKEILQCEEI